MEKTISRSYDEPEDFAEGIEMDGEQRAFKTYLNKRKQTSWIRSVPLK